MTKTEIRTGVAEMAGGSRSHAELLDRLTELATANLIDKLRPEGKPAQDSPKLRAAIAAEILEGWRTEARHLWIGYYRELYA